ncbi:hypothetical protein JCM1840_003774 [Sporobolomyces johnsonii]
MVGSTGLKTVLLTVGTLASTVAAQTFRRSAACPGLGCIYPPDQTEFIAGQVFDIRIEVQAPLNGSTPFNNGVPSPDFSLTISGDGAEPVDISNFYGVESPVVQSYNFSYYEDLFNKDNGTATLVNVLAQDWRYVTLYNPGEYTLKLSYNGGMQTLAHWTVLPLAEKRTAKNVILMVGDGMAPSMVTAARMIGHKAINGKYQTHMAMDKPEGFGLQMTHSLDSYITDSANSATALMAGKKSTVNALNAYTDSTGKPLNNPKFETIFEMGRRVYGAQIGIVSTAYLADATPAAVVAHTSQRSQYDYVIDQYLDGVTSNFSWTKWDGPDVLFGGGGADFVPKISNGNVSKIERFQKRGYEFVTTNTSLHEIGNDKRALGLFSASTMPTWLDRNIFKEQNLADFKAWNPENGTFTAPTVDTPGLKEMTIKAIDILSTRSKKAGVPFMLMSEAASIDKAMHVGDMERAISELLELDNTVKTVLAHLEKIGHKEDTLVVVTADHGHGFDVFGSADTAYLQAQTDNDKKRQAVGTYLSSGLSGYQAEEGMSPQNQTVVFSKDGPGFPVNWSPRYTAAWGFAADVDRYENYEVHNKTRETSIKLENGTYRANEEDAPGGFFVSGNLPVGDDQGVHSLVDVPVYAWGPGHELFRGIQNSPEIAFKIAHALDLGRDKNVTNYPAAEYASEKVVSGRYVAQARKVAL